MKPVRLSTTACQLLALQRFSHTTSMEHPAKSSDHCRSGLDAAVWGGERGWPRHVGGRTETGAFQGRNASLMWGRSSGCMSAWHDSDASTLDELSVSSGSRRGGDTTVFMCELWWVSVTDHRMVEVVQLPFRASIRAEPVPATLFRDWTTATSMVVLVFVRVRSGASAQLSGAYSGDQCNVLVRTIR